MMSVLLSKPLADSDYPSSDGESLGEFEIHFRVISSLFDMLDFWFKKKPMVHVASDLMVYYEEGNPYRFVVPDIQVTFGIPKLPPRRTFLAWKEGKGPDFIIEVSSKSTFGNDQKSKFEIYRDILKVQEYFLFDPLQEHLITPFVGYTLIDGDYEMIKPVNGRLPSKITGLHLEHAGQFLRLFDPGNNKYLSTYEETVDSKAVIEAQLRETERANELVKMQAEKERKDKLIAEAEADRLRNELEALRGQLPGQS
jgi:Uma2 family endonuclease